MPYIIVRKRTVFLFLTLAGLLVYINTFRAPFHYDDFHFLKHNIIIKSFSLFVNWISENPLRIITERAFLLFTFYLNYIVNGLDTFGYHIVNIFIHVTTAFVFYLLISEYVEKSDGGKFQVKALTAATLFLVHPINTESVAYISSRSSELSGLFIIAAIFMFSKACSGQFSPIRYLLSLLFFIFGLSTKQAAVITPALLLLFDGYFIAGSFKDLRRRLIYHLPFWMIILVGSYHYSGIILQPEMYDRPWSTHIFTELKVVIVYLRLFILPFGQNIDHTIQESNTFDAGVLISSAVIACLIVASFLFKRKNKVLSFSILWFFISIAPFMLIRLADYMAERWVYTATMGASLCIAELIVILISRKKTIGIITLTCGLLFYGILAFVRNNVYKNPVALWSDALQKSPQKARPYTNLSVAYLERGEIDKAIGIMERSIAMGNREIEMYLNLAIAHFMRDDLEKAERILLSVRDEIAGDVFYYDLGIIYKFQKRYNSAIEEFSKVLKIKPNSTAALGSMGECYDLIGRKDKARELYLSAIKGIPQNAEEYLVLAKSYFALGDSRMGSDSLNKALISDPFNIHIRNMIATTLLEKNRLNDAYNHFSIMVKISPNFAPAYRGMGFVMLKKGNLKQARKYFQKAIDLFPPDSKDRKGLLELLNKT